MKTTEITGRTVDEAIETALKELNVSLEQIETEVLEEPAKGFLGILGSRQARVKIIIKEDPIEMALEFLKPILVKLEIKPEVKTRKEGEYYYLSFHGHKLGLMIGHRGETLDALQYLSNLAVNRKTKNHAHIILDVENYRKKREETLNRLARKLAEKAKKTGRRVMLEPMSPHERRIIHTALQDDQDVDTFSEGQEPYRKVVISLK